MSARTLLASVAWVAACWARSSSEESRLLCSCTRVVTNAPSATNATATPTAIVVSRVIRLASERR